MAVCLDKAFSGLGASILTVGIDKLSQLIKKSIEGARAPANDLPPFLTSIESMYRPGLSAIALTSSIVSRLGEAGINCGVLPDGSEPQLNKVIRIVSEETIKEIQLNSKIMVEIPSGVNVGQAGAVPVISSMPIQGGAVLL